MTGAIVIAIEMGMAVDETNEGTTECVLTVKQDATTETASVTGTVWTKEIVIEKVTETVIAKENVTGTETTSEESHNHKLKVKANRDPTMAIRKDHHHMIVSLVEVVEVATEDQDLDLGTAAAATVILEAASVQVVADIAEVMADRMGQWTTNITTVAITLSTHSQTGTRRMLMRVITTGLEPTKRTAKVCQKGLMRR